MNSNSKIIYNCKTTFIMSSLNLAYIKQKITKLIIKQPEFKIIVITYLTSELPTAIKLVKFNNIN